MARTLRVHSIYVRNDTALYKYAYHDIHEMEWIVVYLSYCTYVLLAIGK